MMKHLNLSSDEPTRTERATPSTTPSAPHPQPISLPGQTALDSGDFTGVGDSLNPHAVLNNALKGAANIRRSQEEEGYPTRSTAANIQSQEEGYPTRSTTTTSTTNTTKEDNRGGGVCSRACNTRNNVVDVGVQVAGVSVGVQAVLSSPPPAAAATPRIHTADKCVQVSTPMLMRATTRSHLDSSYDHVADKCVQVSTPMLTRATPRATPRSHSDSSYDSGGSVTHKSKTNETRKTVSETSFSTRRKIGNSAGRPGTPVTNISKKGNNASGDRIASKNNSSNSSHGHGTYKRTNNNSRTGNNRNRRNRLEGTDITVLDIAGDSD